MAINFDLDYQFLKDSYTGRGGYLDGRYLIKFPNESDEKFKNRKEYATLFNFCKKIVNSIVGHVFKKSPVRKTEDSPWYETFMNNTDRRGTFIDDKMNQLLKLTLINGVIFIITDKPRISVKTALEEKELKVFPYITFRKPTQLHDYSIDEFGNLTYIVFKEVNPENPQNFIYRKYTENEWFIADDDQFSKIRDSGEHKLGVVPVIPFSVTQLEDDEILSTPFILEIARLQKDFYNVVNELRTILRDNTFPILTFPVKNDSSIEALRNQGLSLSTNNGLLYNAEAGAKPEFIAPPSEPTEAYLSYMEVLIRQIFKEVNLDFANSKAESGLAKQYDYLEFTTMLVNFANALEACEYRIAELVGKWLDEEFKGYIEYSKQFTILDAEQFINTVLTVLDRPDLPPILHNELMKLTARFILNPFKDEKELDQIENAIDSSEDYELKLRAEGWNS